MTGGHISGEQFESDEQATAAAKHEEEAAMYLIEKYKPLVLRFSRARFLAGGEHEDLVQEGMIGLYKAIRDYDPSRDTSFSSFAGLCIDRQILKAIEAYGRDKMKPLNESVGLTGDEEPFPEQTLGGDPESIVIEREAADEQLRLLCSICISRGATGMRSRHGSESPRRPSTMRCRGFAERAVGCNRVVPSAETIRGGRASDRMIRGPAPSYCSFGAIN